MYWDLVRVRVNVNVQWVVGGRKCTRKWNVQWLGGVCAAQTQVVLWSVSDSETHVKVLSQEFSLACECEQVNSETER